MKRKEKNPKFMKIYQIKCDKSQNIESNLLGFLINWLDELVMEFLQKQTTTTQTNKQTEKKKPSNNNETCFIFMIASRKNYKVKLRKKI